MTTPQQPASSAAPLFEIEPESETTAKHERTLILGLSANGAPTDLIRPAGSAPAAVHPHTLRPPALPAARRPPARPAPPAPPTVPMPVPMQCMYLSPEIVKIAEGFPDPQALAGLVRVMMRTVERNNLEIVQWLEMACTHVLVLGYSSDECTIDHRDRPMQTQHTLKVRGLEVFSVTATRRFDGDAVSTTITPVIIGWPTAKPSR